MRVIFTDYTEGRVLFGGSSNSYYAEPEARQIVVQLEEHREGFIVQVGVGRLKDFAGNPRTFVTRWERKSPLFRTDECGADAEVLARAWATTFCDWAVDNWTCQLTGEHDYPVEFSRTGFCPSCDRADTIVLEQQAWYDVWHCSADDCDWTDQRSIGD